MPPVSRFFPLLPALCLAACSGTGGEADVVTGSPDPVALNRIKSGDPLTGDHDQRKIEEKFGSYSQYTKGKDGKPLGEGKQFAGFDRENPEFKGNWQGKDYKGGDYKKASAWGDKDYVTKVYGGNTDASSLRKDSRFSKRKAGEGGVAARGAGKDYQTASYDTGSAREQGRDGIAKPSDAETDVRRRVFTEPDIIPWKSQGMTVEDTNRMMGR
ncbi:hypothetical protein [Luteolibacter marinus]|uniref:hypothetical protein n=1 Tax=Luteolibacter marinus TaxID=2776705 RepID=UPI0018672BEF|nr:hypothetical protein [Luteolibacter marinus]